MNEHFCPNATHSTTAELQKHRYGTAGTHAAPICCISACWRLMKTNWRVLSRTNGCKFMKTTPSAQGLLRLVVLLDTSTKLSLLWGIFCMFTCNVLLLLLGLLFEILQFPHGVCSGYCYPWDLGQTTWGGPSERGVSTIQQKLPVIDDAGACM